jgi:hypothetical protein
LSKQAVALIAGLLVAGLLVVGCGDDDSGDGGSGASAAETTASGGETDGDGASADTGRDTDTDETASVSKAAFIKQADELCATSAKKVSANATKLLKKGANFDDKDFQVEVIQVALAPELTVLLEDLEALGAPSGDEEQIEAILATVEERADRANDDPQGFLEEEGKRGGPLYKEGQALAKRYGFKKCMQ